MNTYTMRIRKNNKWKHPIFMWLPFLWIKILLKKKGKTWKFHILEPSWSRTRSGWLIVLEKSTPQNGPRVLLWICRVPSDPATNILYVNRAGASWPPPLSGHQNVCSRVSSIWVFPSCRMQATLLIQVDKALSPACPQRVLQPTLSSLFESGCNNPT